jgi:hypothetical protein
MRGHLFCLSRLRTERGRQKVDLFTVHVAVIETAFTATERQMPPLKIRIAHPPGARPGINLSIPKPYGLAAL